MHKQTPSQTVGPYFAYGLTPEQYGYDFKELINNELSDPYDAKSIHLSGQVFDGEGQLIPDAMIELWYCEPDSKVFGRYGTGTDPQSRFHFYSLAPSQYLTLIVFMRGQLIHSYTRVYFNEADIPAEVPKERRKTLLAQGEAGHFTFDIHMQGPKETVFFQI